MKFEVTIAQNVPETKTVIVEADSIEHATLIARESEDFESGDGFEFAAEPAIQDRWIEAVEPVRMYNLQRPDGTLIGGGVWKSMTHQEAITARSKFNSPGEILLVPVHQNQESV